MQVESPIEAPVAKTGMLIRRPVAEVFEAFCDPAAITQFWFTKSSGRLAADATVRWDWEMYGVHADVHVLRFEQDRLIAFEWPGANGMTTVEWAFQPLAEGTFVGVTDSGFQGTPEERVAQAMDSTQGFSLVLAGAKAYLEHRIRLELVRDRYPRGVEA